MAVSVNSFKEWICYHKHEHSKSRHTDALKVKNTLMFVHDYSCSTIIYILNIMTENILLRSLLTRFLNVLHSVCIDEFKTDSCVYV